MDIAPQGQEALRQIYGDGKPVLFVSAAVRIAAIADELAEFIGVFTTNRRTSKHITPVPSLGPWLRMYRQHNQAWNAITALGMCKDGVDCTGQEAARGLRELVAMTPDDRKPVLEESFSEDELLDLAKLFLGIEFPPPQEQIAAMLAQFDAEGDDTTDSIEGVLGDVEWQFFIRVWAPCWILYREYPPMLMRAARMGDIEAIDRLVRLDKSAIHERVIAEHWHRIMHGPQRGPRQKLLRAMSGQPKGKLDSKKVRSYLAGMISQIANAMKCPVEEPEIRELFKRIAIARGKRNDYSLPPGSDALKKSIHRNRNWPSFPRVKGRTKKNS